MRPTSLDVEADLGFFTLSPYGRYVEQMTQNVSVKVGSH